MMFRLAFVILCIAFIMTTLLVFAEPSDGGDGVFELFMSVIAAGAIWAGIYYFVMLFYWVITGNGISIIAAIVWLWKGSFG